MSDVSFNELLERYLDGELSSDEARNLHVRLNSDTTLRTQFLSDVRWHIRLSEHLNVPRIPLVERVDALLDAYGHAPRVAKAVAARITSKSSQRHRVSARISARIRRRPPPQQLVWFAAAAAGLLVLVTAFVLFTVSTPVGMSVSGERGLVLRQGQELLITTRAIPIENGDVVQAIDANVQVRFVDGTAVELLPRTALAVREGARRGTKSLLLTQGSLFAEVTPQPATEPMSITTAYARATVVGTAFRLNTDAMGTRLEVTHGRIAFARASGGEALLVDAGKRATAGSDGSLSFDREPASVAIAQTFSPTSGRPFSSDSPYNRQLPQAPAIDPASQAMLSHMGEYLPSLTLYNHAIPVYDADTSTPHERVQVLRPARESLAHQVIPIPPHATPSIGEMDAMVILDWPQQQAWGLFKFERTSMGVTVLNGGPLSLLGNGISDPPVRFAGGSLLSGLIRVHEIAAGEIPHALALGTGFLGTTVRYPARLPEQGELEPGMIPLGACLQLDPALDIAHMPGLTRAERIIAVALQRYGAYCVGRSGIGFLFYCERATDASGPNAPGAVYSAAGLRGDGTVMTGIPWSSLRVLQQWDGRAAKTQ